MSLIVAALFFFFDYPRQRLLYEVLHLQLVRRTFNTTNDNLFILLKTPIFKNGENKVRNEWGVASLQSEADYSLQCINNYRPNDNGHQSSVLGLLWFKFFKFKSQQNIHSL